MKPTKTTPAQEQHIRRLKGDIQQLRKQLRGHSQAVAATKKQILKRQRRLANARPSGTKGEVSRAVTAERRRIAFILQKQGWKLRDIGALLSVSGSQAGRMAAAHPGTCQDSCQVCGQNCFGNRCERHQLDVEDHKCAPEK